ncbi:glycosyltransferase family 2 protein [Streptomyces sp. NPDC058947]|uniref:glycosyltransferase family 2 protein n=1 Tax=Streptomyces sp. NPDC058947 TaxID=3346675 RepID=UPI0036BB99B4
MKHTVLVPAWRRPDMLHACLSCLEAAAGRHVSVVVSLDRGSDPGCRSVAEQFSRRLPSIYLREMYQHPYRGNSCNVISGIKDCLKLGGDLLHIVEEDVFVARGYFDFHEAMHEAAPTAFAVSACRNQNQIRPVEQAAYLHPSYQSLGVSLRSEVAQRVTPHDTPLYYGNMMGYCSKVFTSSIIPSGHAEQDGLINRIRESLGGRTVYANRPRAFHAGFHGYNRPGTQLSGGTVAERAARILAMTSEEMNALAGELKDHEVINLEEHLSVEPEREALSATARI